MARITQYLKMSAEKCFLAGIEGFFTAHTQSFAISTYLNPYL